LHLKCIGGVSNSQAGALVIVWDAGAGPKVFTPAPTSKHDHSFKEETTLPRFFKYTQKVLLILRKKLKKDIVSSSGRFSPIVHAQDLSIDKDHTKKKPSAIERPEKPNVP
jgi:hypothetical protein